MGLRAARAEWRLGWVSVLRSKLTFGIQKSCGSNAQKKTVCDFDRKIQRRSEKVCPRGFAHENPPYSSTTSREASDANTEPLGPQKRWTMSMKKAF